MTLFVAYERGQKFHACEFVIQIIVLYSLYEQTRVLNSYIEFRLFFFSSRKIGTVGSRLMPIVALLKRH